MRRRGLTFSRPRRTDMMSLNVTRFGAGYWIGGIALTSLSLLFPLAKTSHSEMLTAFLLPMVVDVVTISSFAGLFLAFVHLVQGFNPRNREMVLSGFLGLLLCGLALLWVTIDSLQEVARQLMRGH